MYFIYWLVKFVAFFFFSFFNFYLFIWINRSKPFNSLISTLLHVPSLFLMAFWLVPFRNVYWEADVADDTNALYCVTTARKELWESGAPSLSVRQTWMSFLAGPNENTFEAVYFSTIITHSWPIVFLPALWQKSQEWTFSCRAQRNEPKRHQANPPLSEATQRGVSSAVRYTLVRESTYMAMLLRNNTPL